MVHFRLPIGQFGLVFGGHFGRTVVTHTRTPLDEAEAKQKRTKTGVGGYPHGAGDWLCEIIPAFRGGTVQPTLMPQLPPLTAGPHGRHGQSQHEIQSAEKTDSAEPPRVMAQKPTYGRRTNTDIYIMKFPRKLDIVQMGKNVTVVLPRPEVNSGSHAGVPERKKEREESN